ncbi:MAG: cytochrome c maturation protein CcmE [Pseudomonadales bacterium]
MHPKRRNRLAIVLFLLAGAGITVSLVLLALNENLNLFYPPDQIVSGGAPTDTRIRAGGMVEDGSVRRSAHDLNVEFVVTDHQGSEFTVRYAGILPDLFREGQGILVQGQLGADGVFHADEVLAKHDENYMPPELADMRRPDATAPARPDPGFGS